jgi:hypothetical protein
MTSVNTQHLDPFTATMRQLTVLAASLLVTVAAFTAAESASAQSPGSPGWTPPIIATGADREYLRSLPIEQRPNRPLHFYGNTVRRMQSRPAAPQRGAARTVAAQSLAR